MAGEIVAFDRFYGDSDLQWANIESSGGPIYLTDREKRIQGMGTLIDQLGFWWSWPAGYISQDGDVIEFPFIVPAPATQAITLVSIQQAEGISGTTRVSILFNSFPTPSISLRDHGDDLAAGSTPLNEFETGTLYRGKFEIRANGKIRAYVTTPTQENVYLGETVIATDYLGKRIYFQAQQTFIDPITAYSAFRGFFIHRSGTTFNTEDFMAYCTTAEVQAEFPALTLATDTTTGITAAEISTWIEEISAYMDSQIQNRYVTPVTAPASALMVLKMICKDFVCGKLKGKLFILSGGKSESQREQSEALTKQAEARLKMIRTGESVLGNADSSASTQGVPTMDSYGRKNGVEPAFDIEKQQW